MALPSDHDINLIPGGYGDDQAGRWTAIVLAGSRPDGDPLAAALHVPLKALIALHERTLLDYVVEALSGVDAIGHIYVMAQDVAALAGATARWPQHRVSLVISGPGIATSIEAIAGTAQAPWPVLVTTADNALLTSDRVQSFLDRVGDVDIAVGVGERSIVERDFPETDRTWLKFSDGHFSGANLFALSSSRCRAALRRWAQIEADRKKGFKLVTSFGPALLMRALTRTITFPAAMARAAATLGCTAKPIVLDAEAPIDVDKPADLDLVARILSARTGVDASRGPAAGASIDA